MELTEYLLKYKMITDGARVIIGAAEWKKAQGSLLGMGSIIGVTVKNIDFANNRSITVNDDTVLAGSFMAVACPTPGGEYDINSLKISWPDGDAPVSIVIDRITNLRYIKIPVLSK